MHYFLYGILIEITTEGYILMIDIVYLFHVNIVKRGASTFPTLLKIIQVFFAKVAQMFDSTGWIFQNNNNKNNHQQQHKQKTFQNVLKLLQLQKNPQNFNLRGFLLEFVDVLL